MERLESMAEKESSAVRRKAGREILHNEVPRERDDSGKLSAEQLSSLRARYESFYTILDGIDFAYLRTECETLARKSGIAPETLNFLGPDRILPYTRKRRGLGPLFSQTTRGSYNLEENISSFDWHVLESAHANSERAWLLPFHLLKVLVHEEVHAVSKGVCNDLETESGLVQTRRTGYEEKSREYLLTKDEDGNDEYEEGGGELNFRLFNEGVVEKLSQEILEQYVQQAADKNFDQETARAFLAWHREHPQLKSYQEEVLLVESFVSLTAAATGLSEETVWEGVIRGLFEGDVFDTPEITHAFKEVAGFDLIKHLRHATSFDKKSLEALRTDIEKRAAFIKTLEEAHPLKRALLQSMDRLALFRRK